MLGSRPALLVSLLAAGCMGAGAIPRATPPNAVDNPHRTLAWVSLRQQWCTGRRQFGDPRCDHYTIRVFADGLVQWDGIENVATVGQQEHRIAASEARRLIDDTDRRLRELSEIRCGVDHTHYVWISVGRPDQALVREYGGCGRRYYAAGRAIDRVAGSMRLR